MKQKFNPPKTGLVLEIGSGDNPNPRSNVLVDRSQRAHRLLVLLAAWRQSKRRMRAQLETGEVESVLLDRPDPTAPVSTLLLWGRKQDLAFEQEVGRSARQRNCPG